MGKFAGLWGARLANFDHHRAWHSQCWGRRAHWSETEISFPVATDRPAITDRGDLSGVTMPRATNRRASEPPRCGSHLGGLFALVLTLGTLPVTRQAPGAEPPANASTVQTSTTSLALPQDRQIDQWFEAAVDSLDRSDFGTAAVLIDRLVRTEVTAYVAPRSGPARPAQLAAIQLLERLPVERRERVSKDLGMLGDEAWRAAHDAGRDPVIQVACRYRSSPAGLEALSRIAAAYRDEGRHQQAAMAWLAVSRHPLIATDRRARAVLAGIDSLVIAGAWDDADRFARLLEDDIPVRIAGRPVSTHDWIARRLQGRPNTTARPPSRPAFQPDWNRPATISSELDQAVLQIQHYYREQGIVSSSMLRPVVTKDLVLLRTMQDLQAIDLKSGQPRWSQPNHEYAWIQKRQASLENGPFRTATAAAWHRRLEADSVFSSITVHGDLVVVVQEPDRTNLDFAPPGGPARGAQPVSGGRWNKLCGYAASDGQLQWQIGGPVTGPADVFGGVSFLGAPLFLDNQLFCIARRDDELCLLVLDAANGHQQWSLELGVLPPHLIDALSRRRIACPVVACDNIVICTTAIGTVVAVDPATRTVQWAARYPTLQHEYPVRAGAFGASAVLPDLWWNEWREVGCAVAPLPAPLVILASPDSNQLLALDVATGQTVWQTPRATGLHLVGVTDRAAIVTEGHGVAAYELSTGKVAWRVETGEVAGRGTLVQGQVFQPCRNGGTAIIDVLSGQVSAPWETEILQANLVPCDGGWISQTARVVQRFPRLDDTRTRWQQQWERERTEVAAIELARLELQSGQPGLARQRVAGFTSPDARTVQRRALIALANGQDKTGPALTPDEGTRLGTELLEACQTDEERAQARRILGDLSRRLQRPAQAIDHYLEGLELVESVGLRTVGDWPVDELATRFGRADRVLLGGIARALSESAVAADGEMLLESRLDAARGSTDPFALQRTLDRLLPLPWGQRVFVREPAAVTYARPLHKLEPVLLTLAGATSANRSARALELLADAERQAGWPQTAEILDRRLLADFPGTPLSDGMTLSARLAAAPSLEERRAKLVRKPAEPWPERQPTVALEQRRRMDVHFVPVRITPSYASLLDRLEVSVDRQGRKVRFVSEGHSGSWELLLPGTPRLLRAQFANLDQIEAHAVGRLLVLRVGSEVFGIRPFNERGEPIAALTALQLDMAPRNSDLPNEAWWYQEPLPGRVGIRAEGLRLVDGLGRPFGGLGPVRPGYLCYRSQARLVAIETQSGRRLWERPGLPAQAQVFGDDEFVFVWHLDRKVIEVLSAIDGSSLREYPWDVAPDDLLMSQSDRAWTVRRSTETRVELCDLRTGRPVWSQSYPENSVPFVLDATTLAVLDPRGVLHLLVAASGTSLGEPLTVDVPERVERIVVQHDAERWYVAISAPVPRLPFLQSEQPWGASRMAFVRGWLYGIDRSAGAISWRRFLEAEPVPQHATPLAPVLVQHWRQPGVEGIIESNQSGEGILRVLDKRTGRELTSYRDPNLQAYHILQPVADREQLDVCTEHVTIHLNYAAVPATQTP